MEGTSSEDRWVNGHADAWATYMPLKAAPINQDKGLQNVEVWRGQHPHDDEQPEHVSIPIHASIQRTLDGSGGAFGSLQKSFSSLYPDINLPTFNTATFSQIEGPRMDGRWPVASGANEIFPGIFDETSGPISLGHELTCLRPPICACPMASHCALLRWPNAGVEGVWATTHYCRKPWPAEESGNNWEIGLVQEKGKGVSMLLEAAVFVLNYDEMIEYTLLPRWTPTTPFCSRLRRPDVFLQTAQLGQTRIAGLTAAQAARESLVPFERSRATPTTTPGIWPMTLPRTAWGCS